MKTVNIGRLERGANLRVVDSDDVIMNCCLLIGACVNCLRLLQGLGLGVGLSLCGICNMLNLVACCWCSASVWLAKRSPLSQQQQLTAISNFENCYQQTGNDDVCRNVCLCVCVCSCACGCVGAHLLVLLLLFLLADINPSVGGCCTLRAVLFLLLSSCHVLFPSSFCLFLRGARQYSKCASLLRCGR